MRDIELMADGVIAAAKGYVDRVVDGLAKRLNELSEAAAGLDARLAALPAPKDGSPGSSAFQIACMGGFRGSESEWLESLRGKDAAVDEPAIVARVVAQIPAPESGKDAEVDYERLGGMVTATVGAAIAALPVPEKGDPGKDGDSVDIEAVRAMVDIAVAALPTPKDGKDADPEAVIRLVKGEVAQAILLLPRPKDGEDGKSVTVDDVRGLVDGVIRDAVSKLPVPKDGTDGLGFDDLAVEYDGRRAFAIKFQRGEEVKEFAFTLPVILDAGVFRRGDGYEKGDTVTWDGSMWIAQRATGDKPGESDAWRLSVKHGRDGKDFDAPKPPDKQVVRLR